MDYIDPGAPRTDHFDFRRLSVECHEMVNKIMAYVAPRITQIGRASRVVLGNRLSGFSDNVVQVLVCGSRTQAYDITPCEITGEW